MYLYIVSNFFRLFFLLSHFLSFYRFPFVLSLLRRLFLLDVLVFFLGGLTIRVTFPQFSFRPSSNSGKSDTTESLSVWQRRPKYTQQLCASVCVLRWIACSMLFTSLMIIARKHNDKRILFHLRTRIKYTCIVYNQNARSTKSPFLFYW